MNVVVRPWALVPMQVLPCVLFGGFLIALQPPAAVLALGVASVTAGLLTLVPVVKLTDHGITARNVVRRGRWAWDDIETVRLGSTALLFTRAMSHSQLVLDSGSRQFRLAATTRMSREKAAEVIEVLDRCGQIDARVTPDRFPRTHPKVAMDEQAAEAIAEREETLDTYRRLDEVRKRKP